MNTSHRQVKNYYSWPDHVEYSRKTSLFINIFLLLLSLFYIYKFWRHQDQEGDSRLNTIKYEMSNTIKINKYCNYAYGQGEFHQ